MLVSGMRSIRVHLYLYRIRVLSFLHYSARRAAVDHVIVILFYYNTKHFTIPILHLLIKDLEEHTLKYCVGYIYMTFLIFFKVINILTI